MAQTQAQSGTDLPFRGSFTSVTEFAPPSPNARATLTGTGSHVGQFVAILEGVVEGSTASGTFTLTAANGHQLSGTWEGVGEFIGPTEVRITEEATIVSGTGHFEGATGTFTLVRVENIVTASGGGTFDGHIDLNR